MNEPRTRATRRPKPGGADTAGIRSRTLAPPGAGDRRAWLLMLLPALAALLAFAPGLRNEFVPYWDDELSLLENLDYRGLGWKNLAWAWTTFHMGVYQPLGWMFYELEYVTWGLDPWGYHLTSLVLYVAEAAAFYVLAVVLLNRCRAVPSGAGPWPVHIGAGLAAALFMAHPLRDEVAVWASCQPYLPAALFATLAVLAYLQAHPEGQPPRLGWGIGAWLLAAAAMLSKAIALTLPAVLLTLDVYPLRRIGNVHNARPYFGAEARGAWLEKLPYFALGGVFAALAVASRRTAQFAALGHAYDQGPLGERIAQACYGVVYYLLRTFWPDPITACDYLPRQISWADPRFALSAVTVVGLSALLLALRRRHPAWLAAWISYLVILAPSSGLSRIGGQLTANRYSYLAMMGLAILAAAALARLGRTRSGAMTAIGLAGVLLAVWIPLSRRQCAYWHDSIVLWRHAMAHSEIREPTVHVNLGKALFTAGQTEASVESFAEALRYDPHNLQAHALMGRALLRLGRYAEAEEHLAEAVRRNAGDDDRTYLGMALAPQGKLAAAEAAFAEVLRRRPDDAEAHNKLGTAQAQQGKLAAAIGQFREAIRLQPDHVGARKNLGEALSDLGSLDEARTTLEEVLRRAPQNAEAHLLLGRVLLRQGQLDAAEPHLQRAASDDHQAAPASATLKELARLRSRPGAG